MTDHDYVCATCGKTHKGLPTDWGFQFPDEVWGLRFLEKYRRTRSNSDLCTLDENRFFFRGLLSIPFNYQEGDFSWGVWVEVTQAVHDFYLENYSNEMTQGVTAVGTIANAIPGMPDIMGQSVEIEFQNAKSRPYFTFPISAEIDLADDQRNGIDQDRHHQFLELCGYFKESDA